MTAIIIYCIAYFVGYFLSFCILRIEQEADGEVYTKGDRAACFLISLFSFVAVLFLLVSSWVGRIKATGYWDRPIKQTDELE